MAAPSHCACNLPISLHAQSSLYNALYVCSSALSQHSHVLAHALPLFCRPGAQQVRFVDVHCTWLGSTGAAAGGAGGSSSSGGLDLMPVYVPAYVFSWWHGGAKVRIIMIRWWL